MKPKIKRTRTMKQDNNQFCILSLLHRLPFHSLQYTLHIRHHHLSPQYTRLFILWPRFPRGRPPKERYTREAESEQIRSQKTWVFLTLALDKYFYLFEPQFLYLQNYTGTSLVVQWLRPHTPNALGGPGSIPSQGTRSRMHNWESACCN